jgi:HSP20 family protein
MSDKKNKPPGRSSGHVGVVVEHAVYRSFSQFAQTEVWSPAVNVYQVPGRVLVCVDLAGIERDKIDVRIEPGRLTISGVRNAPEPDQQNQPSAAAPTPGAPGSPGPHGQMKILSMEIDYGAFCRQVPVPNQIDLDRVNSEYRAGILWITLPLK